MKKTKILLGALSLVSIAPVMPLALTSCGCSQGDQAYSPKITKGEHIKSYALSTTELNRALSITCVCDNNWTVDPSTTTIKVGGTQLTLDKDYIVYYDVIIISSKALTNKDVVIDIKAKSSTETSKYTITLYTNDGTFEGGSNTLVINNVEEGTKLFDVIGYKEPTKTDYDFAFWMSSSGQIIKKEDVASTQIKSNMLLAANFVEHAGTPSSFKNDNWATMAVACKSAVAFANAYLGQSFAADKEADAITYINNEIKSNATEAKNTLPPKNIDIISDAGGTIQLTVKLIGCGVDKELDDTNKKTKFTWEFVDVIDEAKWSAIYKDMNDWVWHPGQEDEASCYLRMYCNLYLIQCLPASVINNIVPVAKQTLKARETSTEEYTYITTEELLFPLSAEEYGVNPKYTGEQLTYTVDAFYPYYQPFKNEKIVDHNAKKYLGYDIEEVKPYYWLRTPHTTFDSAGSYMKCMYYNGVGGAVRSDYSYRFTWGIAPAFCI